MICVLQAEEKDRDEVLRLVENLLRELEDASDEFGGIERRKILQDLEQAGRRFTAFLARDAAGEAIGVATVVETFAIYAGGVFGVIDEMYVDPAHRSRGIGKLLIDAVKAHAREREWVRVDVTAPPEKKWERTVRFYEAQGFVFTGPKLRYRVSDAGA